MPNVFRGLWFVLILSFILTQSCQKSQEDYETETNTDKLFTLLSPESTGVDFQNPVKETKSQNHLTNDMLISGAGVTIADINNDDLPDIYFTGNQVTDKLFLNLGGLKFKDITKSAGIKLDKIWSSGATFADVNHDGFADLYVCKYVQEKSQLGKNLLYINNGDLTFTEKAAEYGLADRGFSVHATFFDFDMDGYLDVYLINQPPSLGNRKGNKITLTRIKSLLYTDKIYKNVNGESFFDATNWAGVQNLAFGLSATVGDFNNDLMPDIYVANDYEKPDHLYINVGNGKYRNTVNQSIKHMSNFSMGTDIADFDNDGFLDLVVVDMVAEDHKRIKTNMGGMDPEAFWDIVNKGWHYQYMFNTLQKNNGNGTFSEIAHLAGVSNTDWSWSALFADFDNDGWKDLFVTNGVKRAMRNSDLDQKYSAMFDSLEIVAQKAGKNLWDVMDIMKFVEMAPIEKMKNYIYKNNGDLTFSKKTDEWGLDIPTLSFGAAYADLDLDGDLELIVNNTDDYAHVYRNNTIEKGIGNYLKVKVVNEHQSPAYGAKVKLYQNGEFWQLQELTNTRGYKSKSEDIAHFGLGNIEVVDKIEIIWPDGKKLFKNNVKANQYLRINPSEAALPETTKKKIQKLFTEVSRNLNIEYLHKENKYDDYSKEILLPHKMSNFGPGLATGDVTGDGLQDFYVGGASGFPGTLFIQKDDGTFDKSVQEVFEDGKFYEDLGAEFFDADSDSDLDLYVVSGGNEFKVGAKELQDRLYTNDGKGNFSISTNSLPKMYTSGSRVYPGDYDDDNDLDLFVGGRLVPGKYPFPAKSYILRNDGGKFTDVTHEIAEELEEAGLVTSAVWSDFSGDGKLDLAIVGEWMPITVFEQVNDKFINKTLESGLGNTSGWYYSIISKDFDKDGDKDFIVGNLGLNYKYKASEEEPFEVYATDFDNNGDLDIVLGYHEDGQVYPLRGKSCSSQQLPGLKEKFPTFEAFADANLGDVYGDDLDEALHYKATTFASGYIENLGNGTFTVHKLPNEAQLSSINSIIADDFNNDGNLDLLMSGNLYPAEIETPRNDANMGMYLIGDGHGNFASVPLWQSGFFAPHDAKDMKMITLGKGLNKRKVILVANNQGWMQAIEYNPDALKSEKNKILSMQ